MSEIKREQLLMALIAGRGPAYLRGLNLSSMDLSHAGWLVEADLRQADLSNANLKRSNLFRANLEKADLHSANLIGANLDEATLMNVKANVANFNVTRLRGANMRGISLVGASLVRADLEEADLEGADLEGANLEGSNLRRARLGNANLKLVNLEGADLTETILDCGQDRHDGPASLSDFHGTITSIKLADLIQIGCLSRSDLEIEVGSGTERGSIYIGDGRVLHAQSGKTEGEEALLRILSWESGRFTTKACAPGGTVSIEKPVEHLLLQAVRLRDEEKYDGRYSGFVRKIRDCIPVEARASESLVEFLGEDGKKLSASDKIEITDVFDSGDGDEIMCSVAVQDEVFIAPLKLINLDRGHPLYGEMAKLASG